MRIFLVPVATCATFVVPVGPAAAQPVMIENGSRLLDTRGLPVQAHGAGVVRVGDYFYMVGENRDGHRFRAVSAYRSRDLKTWEFRRDILNAASAPTLRRSNVERPKIVRNPATGRFVLWAHKENGDDYREARVVVAESDSVDGDYRYVGEFRPLGHESRDMTLFVDIDGAGYLISAARDNYDLHIYRLDASFTRIDALVVVLKGHHREAPAVFRRDGVYFLLTSGATGWNPNRAAYQTAPAMAGPWTDPVPFGDAHTYNSQSTFVLPITGTAGTAHLYMGDQWAGAYRGTPNDSTYVWLPLRFPTATSLTMAGSPRIAIDVAAGTVVPDGNPVRLRHGAGGPCLRVAGAAIGYGAPVALGACDTAPEATVELRASAVGERYVFRHSGLCLGRGRGADAVVQMPCGLDAATRWTRDGGRIVHTADGTSLDVDVRGAPALPATHSAPAVRWIVDPVPPG